MFRNEKESIDATRGLYMTLVKHQTVDRLYDTRNANDILMDLAQRVGILDKLNEEINASVLRGDNSGLGGAYRLAPDKLYTWDEIAERKLKNDFGPNTTFADFEQHAFRTEHLASVADTYNYLSAPDNAVRLPLYFHRLPRNWSKLTKSLTEVGATIPNQDMDDVARHYSAFPIWYEPPNYGPIADYPLYAVQWKDNFTNQNTLDRVGNAWIQDAIDQWAPESKAVHLAPAVAQRYGLQNGDQIWVESTDGGKTLGRVYLSQLIHPECVGIPGNYGKLGLQLNPRALEGAHFNVLMSPEEKDHDPLECSLELAPRVKIYKA
jgi:anaerobic selenocysteine-containing dehydrogenase